MEYAGFDKDFRLTGRVALITGAGGGIGRAIADLFAEKGADLVLAGRSATVEAAARELAVTGRRIVPVVADVTGPADLERTVTEAMGAFGRIDILVNNAGTSYLGPAEDLSLEDWERTIAINLTAPFLLSQLVGREMIAAGRGGRIVNLASMAGVIALERHVGYCATKAGLIMLTRSMALEWGRHGITVNAISPTITLTELGKRAWAGRVGEDARKLIPVGRFADPAEVAACALFLASDAAAMINGENLMIDGGYTIT